MIHEKSKNAESEIRRRGKYTIFSLVRKVRDKENKDAHIQRRPRKKIIILYNIKCLCVREHLEIKNKVHSLKETMKR